MFAGMTSWSRTLVEGIGIRGRVALLAVRGRGRGSPYPVLLRSQLLVAAGLVAVMGGFAVWAPLITAIVVNGVLVILFSAANALKLVMLRQGLRVPAVLNVSDEELSQIGFTSFPFAQAKEAGTQAEPGWQTQGRPPEGDAGRSRACG